MSKFKSMSTQNLLEIINFKSEEDLGYDEIQRAREEYLLRIKEGAKSLKVGSLANNVQTAKDATAVSKPEVKSASAAGVLKHENMPPAPQEPVYSISQGNTPPRIHMPGIFVLVGIVSIFLSTFLFFVISVVTVVLNFSPLLNIYILGSLFLLGTASAGWYFFAAKKSAGIILCRGFAISQIIVAVSVAKPAALLYAALWIAFIAAAEKTKIYW